MPPRMPVLAAVLLACLAAFSAMPAVAQDVPALDDRITDLAGVLSSEDRDVAEEAIADLEDVQLFALFVDTTGEVTVTDYAEEVAAANSLGGNDALLVVAIDDRRDAMWVGDLLDEASDEEIDAILANQVEPRLADGEWGAAIAAAAGGLSDAVGAGAAPPAEDPDPQPAETGDFPWAIAGVILLGIGAFVLWRYWRVRREVGADAEERDRRIGGLAREANALLIETDELIRENAQELGFAEAQFGPEAASQFRAALDAAREELRAAFAIRQRLDDATPEAPEERERLLNEIVQHCRRAEELLAEQTRRFQELRDLERHAPEVLAAQPGAIEAVRGRIPEAERSVGALEAEARTSWEAVRGHVAEATKRLDLATATTRDAQAALDRGDRGAAARGAKAAQSAVAEAAGLLDAIAHQQATLDEARGGLEGALRQARADVAAAEQAATELGSVGQAPDLGAARDKLRAAEAAAAGGARDVVLAYRLAREAEAAADEVIAAARAEAERLQRERAAAEAEIRAAGITVEQAADFITARRHAIGRRPRTRLSEAQQSLERARGLQDHEAAAAVQEARRANALANDAYRLAVNDFSNAQSAGYDGTVIVNGRHYPTGRDVGWGDDIGGAILGGIIGSILSGGGGRAGGGFGGGGFGGGGFPCGGGGFGGGRSFGGGFGRMGGGGRSRGGAW